MRIYNRLTGKEEQDYQSAVGRLYTRELLDRVIAAAH